MTGAGLPQAPHAAGLPGVLRDHAQDPERVALVLPAGVAEERVTYAALWERSARCAAALRARGVRRGDRVALGMATRWEVVAALVAVQRLGCTLVPLHDAPALDRAADARQAAVLAALRAARAAWCLVGAASVESYAAACAAHSLPARTVGLDALFAAPGDGSPQDVGEVDGRLEDGDLALIQFSSGSTASPKGVCLTRANVNAHVAAIGERLHGRADDVTVSWLPLFHDMGLIGAVLTTLWNGSTLVLMRPQDFVRHPLGWIETLSRYRATVTMGPQFAYSLCVARSQGAVTWERLKGADLSRLRIALNGSETVHPELSDRFAERFAALGLRPGVLQPAYGLAENCLAVTMRHPGSEVPVRRVSRAALAEGRLREVPWADPASPDVQTVAGTGFPVRGTRVSVRDDAGHEVPPGRVGHVHVGGLSATAAYCVGDGELVPAAVDGWVPTGDLGALREGELYVIGRAKEIIKSGGRTFVPSDIEAALSVRLAEDLAGVAVFGFYDPAHGAEQVVVVAETPRGMAPGAQQALPERIRLCVLQEFQLPVREVVSVRLRTIPRTSSGKIQRVRLQTAYAQGALAELVGA
jgi:acyl-CoA synthetase (AMP-forming)/AMP-acid ligase II